MLNSLILALLFSFSSFAVTFNPKLSGSDNQNRWPKYMESVKEAELVVNSPEFKERVLATTFTFPKGMKVYTPAQILQKIEEAAELKYPEKNHEANYELGFYYKGTSKVIGYTQANWTVIYVNEKFFDKYDTYELADNVVHEWLHKLGFDHSSASDRKSVPYAIGYLVSELAYKNIQARKLPVPPVLPKDPAPAPAYKPWWSRLLSIFR